MNTELHKLKKKELLNILSKLKKNEIIEIINNKIGGNLNNSEVERTPIKFSKNKLNKNVKNAMANDRLYNIENNK
jgi:hypothetical protein